MNKIFNFLLIISLATTAVSCKKSDPPLPDNTVNFESGKLGIDPAATETEIKINLARAASVAVPLTVTLNGVGVTYGAEYTTDPASTNNAITLNIPAGSTAASFKVKKVTGAVFNGTETIDFSITSAGNPVVLGSTAKTQLSFSTITSDGSTLTLKGIAGTEAGSGALNSVFVDLSSNTQIGVRRDSWVLGFSSGNDFRVKLNNTNGTSAIKLTKTDLAAVTAGDFVNNDLAILLGETETDKVKPFANIDDVFGDVTKNVIADVSATDGDNKVYIVNPIGGIHGMAVDPTKLWKIRVLRKGAGYTLQYAKVSETTFKTLDITKDVAANYSFVAFDTEAKAVHVEPAKAKWDLVWTWSIYHGGAAGALYPYGFSDIVFVNNVGGVQAAQVLVTPTLTYNNYAEGNIAATVFKADRNVMGSDWRSTSPATGAKVDRFYVIKDATGNIYKLRFVSMGAGDSGKRGEPVIEYKLVKKG